MTGVYCLRTLSKYLFCSKKQSPAASLSIKCKQRMSQKEQLLRIIQLNHNILINTPWASFVLQTWMACSCLHSNKSHYQHGILWSSFQIVITFITPCLETELSIAFSLSATITERGANSHILSSCLSIKAFIRECHQSYMQREILIPFCIFPRDSSACFCDGGVELLDVWSMAR